MTDEQTAAAIVAAFNSSRPMPTMQELIVRALQAAYANGFTNGHTVGINHEANRAVLRMCHEARMCNGIVDYSDQNATGRVRRVMHVSKYPGVSFLTVISEDAEAAKEAK